MEKSLPVPKRASRAGAFIIDILIFFVFAFLIPMVISLILGVNAYPLSGYWFWIGLAYFLLKDALPNGQSIGKRVMGLSVMGFVTYQNCKWWQSIFRNLVLMVLLPVEILFVLLSSRRLGDALVSTMVIDSRMKSG